MLCREFIKYTIKCGVYICGSGQHYACSSEPHQHRCRHCRRASNNGRQHNLICIARPCTFTVNTVQANKLQTDGRTHARTSAHRHTHTRTHTHLSSSLVPRIPLGLCLVQPCSRLCMCLFQCLLQRHCLLCTCLYPLHGLHLRRHTHMQLYSEG